MADPAIQYEDGGPDTSVLAPARLTGPGGALGGATDTTGSVSGDSAVPGFDTRKVTSDLASAASTKLGDDNYIRREFDSRMQENRSRMDQALQLETATANDAAKLHPWNADRERADRIKGPLENFGSIGTIFALAASAFTRTPMTSALNAGAAAMTAMKDNDELAYKSAYQAWKDNTDLVQKRFNMERAVYDDATKFASTDLATARGKLQIAATQFEDTKVLTMLENGMDPQVFQTLEARTNSFDKWVKAKNDFEELNLVNDISQQKFQEWKQAHPPADPNKLTPQENLEQFKAKNQFMLDAKHQVAQSKSVARTGSNPNQQQYDLIRQKYEGDPDAETKIADEYAQFIRNQKGGGSGAGSSTALTADRQHAADTQKIIDDETKNGKLDANDPKAIASRRKEIESQYGGKPITGNERTKLEQRVDKFKHSEDTIDKTLKVLENHPASAGIAGKAMRLEERLTNIMGSKSTDRVQMMRDIELLRAWGQELLFSSRGKLKEEAQRIDSIVGGTSAGDTGPNTVRALRDLKKLYIEMQKEDQSRISGTWTGNTPAPTKPASGKNPWDSDPLVGR